MRYDYEVIAAFDDIKEIEHFFISLSFGEKMRHGSSITFPTSLLHCNLIKLIMFQIDEEQIPPSIKNPHTVVMKHARDWNDK